MVACSGSASSSKTEQTASTNSIASADTDELVKEPTACTDYKDNTALPYKFCDSGSAVMKIQSSLKSMGYEVDIDGYFGQGTKAAIQRFQEQIGLATTGQVGTTTWTQLMSLGQSATEEQTASTYAKSLECQDGQTIYACKARYSDDSLRDIEFPNEGKYISTGSYTDREESVDDYGNIYCVTLYSNGKGSFKGGSCSGSTSSPSGNQAPLPNNQVSGATAVGIICPKFSIETCEVTWSNGKVTWINGYYGSSAPITATTTMYQRSGTRVCVNLHSDGKISTRYC